MTEAPSAGFQAARLVGCDIYLCSIHDWLTLVIRGKPSGGNMMETTVSSALPSGRSATTTAPPREEPATQEPSAPPGDGPSAIDAIEGPVWVAWCEGTLRRAEELEALTLWMALF